MQPPRFQRCGKYAGSSKQSLNKQSLNKPLIRVTAAFVFQQVSRAMRGCQNAPLCGRKLRRVRPTLEHEISVFSAKAHAPERSKCEGVCRVAGEIKTTFDCQIGALGICEPRAPNAQQSSDFTFRRRLALQVTKSRESLRPR